MNIQGAEGLRMQGFMQIELVNEKTGNRQVLQHNAITELGKKLFLATGPAMQLMQPSQLDRGMLYAESALTKVVNGTRMAVEAVDKGITLTLVNSTESLTPQSKLIPVYTNGAVDGDKLIGHASYRRTPSTPKEGVLDQTKGEFLVDDTCVVQRWKFAETQANGTFNKLCIGAGVHTAAGNGFAVSKGINPADLGLFSGVTVLESSYLRPGVTGLTNSNEILVSTVGGTGYPTANAVFNLETGILTLLSTEDPRYGVKLGASWSTQVFYNGNVYFIDKQMTLWRMNATTKETFSMGTAEYMFAEDNKLFYSYNSATIFCFNMQTLADSTADNINLSEQTFTTQWFNSTNTSQVLRSVNVGRDLDGNYLIAPRDYQSMSYGPKYSMVVSNIRNIQGSIVGFRPYAHSACVYAVGDRKVSLWSEVRSDMALTFIYGLSEQDGARALYGLKFSDEWTGNLISYVELSSPITKTADDVMYISYGYRYV